MTLRLFYYSDYTRDFFGLNIFCKRSSKFYLRLQAATDMSATF